jgi:hypothetical protein
VVLASPTCIVAYIGEHGRHGAVRRAAVDLAAGYGSRLIFYDVDAESLFSSPMPNWWSADGRHFGQLLDASDLLYLGRHEMAEHVLSSRHRGVDTWAWLPSRHGAGPLVAYCQNEHADLLVLPAELEHPDMLHRIWAESVDRIRRASSLPVVLVDKDGGMRRVEIARTEVAPSTAD